MKPTDTTIFPVPSKAIRPSENHGLLAPRNEWRQYAYALEKQNASLAALVIKLVAAKKSAKSKS